VSIAGASGCGPKGRAGLLGTRTPLTEWYHWEGSWPVESRRSYSFFSACCSALAFRCARDEAGCAHRFCFAVPDGAGDHAALTRRGLLLGARACVKRAAAYSSGTKCGQGGRAVWASGKAARPARAG